METQGLRESLTEQDQENLEENSDHQLSKSIDGSGMADSYRARYQTPVWKVTEEYNGEKYTNYIDTKTKDWHMVDSSGNEINVSEKIRGLKNENRIKALEQKIAELLNTGIRDTSGDTIHADIEEATQQYNISSKYGGFEYGIQQGDRLFIQSENFQSTENEVIENFYSDLDLIDDDDTLSPIPQQERQTVLDLNSFFGSKKEEQKREEKKSIWDGAFWQGLMKIGSKVEEPDIDNQVSNIFNILRNDEPKTVNGVFGKLAEKNFDFPFLSLTPFSLAVENGITAAPRPELKQESKANDPGIRLLPDPAKLSSIPSLEQTDTQVLELVAESATDRAPVSPTAKDGDNFLEIIKIDQYSSNEQAKQTDPAKEYPAVQNSDSGSHERQPAEPQNLIQSQDVLTIQPAINQIIGHSPDETEKAGQKTSPTLSTEGPTPEISNIDDGKGNDNLPSVDTPNTTAKSSDKPVLAKAKVQTKNPVKTNNPELQQEPEAKGGIELTKTEHALEEKALQQTITVKEIVKNQPEVILDDNHIEATVGLLEKLSLPDDENVDKELAKPQKSIKEIPTNPVNITDETSKDPAETQALQVIKPAEIPANELAQTQENLEHGSTTYGLKAQPSIMSIQRQIRALDKMVVKVATPAEIEEYKEVPDVSVEEKDQAGETEAAVVADLRSEQVVINPRNEPQTKPENKNANSFAQKAIVLKRETAFNRLADFSQKSRAREASVSSILNTLSKLQDSIPEPKALALNEKPAIVPKHKQRPYLNIFQEPAAAFQVVDYNRAKPELKNPAKKVKILNTKTAAKYYETRMVRQLLTSTTQLQQNQTDLTDTQAITLKMTA